MPPIPKKAVKLAILDDYQGIASKHFKTLEKKYGFVVDSYPETLLDYDGKDTPEEVREELVERLKPYTIISAMRERTKFPRELVGKLPELKLILTSGVRNKGIDMEACKEKGIVVTGAIGLGKDKKKKGPDSTTTHTIALILALARGIATDDQNVKTGGWQTGLATGLSGKTLGLVGLGRLGGNVGRILKQSFGMDVIAWSNSLDQEKADAKAVELGLPTEDEDGEKTFKSVSKEELFKNADVVSIHVVLSERSKGIVGKEDLKLMKGSGLLVNTSRGPLVDEEALVEVLEKGAIRGVALDVFEQEPLPEDSMWRSQKWGTEGRSRVLVTPHMGYVEEETMNNWYEEQVEIAERWVKGEELLHILNA